MPVVRIPVVIRAPMERCFDLARSMDFHPASTTGTGERLVGGVTTGLIGLGDEVTFRARHFGVWQELTSRITAFDRPRSFVATMQRGAFARFEHAHRFEPHPEGTLMLDVFDYDAPLGPLGLLAERLFLTRYMERFLRTRDESLKRVAESDAWQRYL